MTAKVLEFHRRTYLARSDSPCGALDAVSDSVRLLSVEITEEQIGNLVETFYAKVRVDLEIGPIFNAIVADWPHHLSVLKDFWSTVLLTTGRYKGDPAIRHIGLGLDPEHFDR